MKINETGSNYSDYYPKERQKVETPSKEFNLEETPIKTNSPTTEDYEKLIETGRKFIEDANIPTLERGKKS